MATAFPRLRHERASRQMLYLRDQYQKAHPNEPQPADPRRIADWAYDLEMWKQKETDPREVLRRKMVRAFRTEYITDPQDREVRANFAVIEEVETPDGPKRMAKFYPIFQAPEHVARQHFQLERRLAVENAVQLTLDLQSYNENNELGVSLPGLDWDIGKDMDEMAQPTEYDPYGDEDEDDE